MSIIWCGGEDIDFPNGSAPSVSTAAATFRAGYARCAVYPGGAVTIKSVTFAAQTSCWVQGRVSYTSSSVSQRHFGIAKSGSNSGIFLGSSSVSGRLAIIKLDNGTQTILATEVGNSLLTSIPITWSLQIVGYGGTCTINAYVDGNLMATYTGSISLTDAANLDQIWLVGTAGTYPQMSEIIVADQDTRLMSVLTGAPTGNGTTNQWTCAHTDINEITLSDATCGYTDTASQAEQYNVTDIPSGYFQLLAVRAAMRAEHTEGSTANAIGLGVKNGANTDTGSNLSLSTSFVTYDRVMNTDPTTSAAWNVDHWNDLQIAFVSA